MGGPGRGIDFFSDRHLDAFQNYLRKYPISVSSISLNRLNDIGLVSFDVHNVAQQVLELAERALTVANHLGARRIVIPGFRRSYIKSQLDFERTAQALRKITELPGMNEMEVAYETVIDATLQHQLNRFALGKLNMQFDLGNPCLYRLSAAEIWRDVAMIACNAIHVKDIPLDRSRGYVPLGNGRAKLQRSFEELAIVKPVPKTFILEGHYFNDPERRLREDLVGLTELIRSAQAMHQA
ncbi:sugar phosphate isomerase/epimerase family protein [Roseobacter weihaiensis]|uniref:sugar phosphate isomerase/epimerase family protein n=1 Tax=Roseobacter weihaiensis TaxID=2763262 RepID=UPI001D0A0DFC|nr:TIM barrel protein [Roseobacter sp. H9]